MLDTEWSDNKQYLNYPGLNYYHIRHSDGGGQSIKIRGSVQNYNQLPSDASDGDVYYVIEPHRVEIEEYQDNIIPANTYRKLTSSEAAYILSNDEFGYVYATVCGTRGVMLFPDDWMDDCGVEVNYENEYRYSSNTFDSEQWSILENNGAVFLPVTYIHEPNTQFPHVNGHQDGGYWLNGAVPGSGYVLHWGGNIYADTIEHPGGVDITSNYMVNNFWYTAIRPVKDVEASVPHSFSNGNGGHIIFATGNIQHLRSINRYRIAPTQYSTCGFDNVGVANMDTYYDQWIDIFAFNKGQDILRYESLAYYTLKHVEYPSMTPWYYDGEQWCPLNGYLNGNLLSDSDVRKLNSIEPGAQANVPSFASIINGDSSINARQIQDSLNIVGEGFIIVGIDPNTNSIFFTTNIETESVYDSSTNKFALMSDVREAALAWGVI